MIAAHVFLNPKLAASTLLQFKHFLELVVDLSIIRLIHSFRFDFDASFPNVEIYSTLKTIAFVALWTVELAFVLYETVITSRGRTPTIIVTCVDDSTYRHLVEAI